MSTREAKQIKILALNCGSSSLKFAGMEVGSNDAKEFFRGAVEIGSGGKFKLRRCDGAEAEETIGTTNHRDAARLVFDRIKPFFQADAVGHRVVHGGIQFNAPVAIDKQVIKALEKISLAPLHNAPALEVILASRELAGEVPMAATFDTAFHHTLPPHARRYAIPEELTFKHSLWRFGFHGLAFRSMLDRYFALSGGDPGHSKIIALQLGSGCSGAAILNGRSIDTTMGLTPLEGLMMATRSGDIDPSLPAMISELEGMDNGEVNRLLNKRSGLLGVSGVSGKVDCLMEQENGGTNSDLALQMFCYRIRKCIGSFLAVLNGADAILFGGGIGENAPQIRSRICEEMSWCGLLLDAQQNTNAIGRESCISSGESGIKAYVIPVNEQAMIARDTFDCLQSR